MRYYLRFTIRERIMLVVIIVFGAALLSQRLHNQASVKQLQREAKLATWMTDANDGVLRKNGYQVIDGTLVKMERP